MLNKIGQKIEYIGTRAHKIVTKTFQRNFQTIKAKSAYYNDKLYYRSWNINQYKHTKKLSQSYSNGNPIKGSKSILDITV